MREVERVISAPGAMAVAGRAIPRWAPLGAVLAASLTWAALLVGATAAPAHGQEDLPQAGPPLSLSQRLQAQGHRVTPAEAAYFDADEQVTDEFVRLLAYVQMVMSVPTTTDGWQDSMVRLLEPMVVLDPERAPVPPPESLATVHAASVGYRAHLSAAALQWLRGVEDNDPAWLQRGLEEYGAAERSRLAWHKALWEYYTGEPAPGP
jgi:hypothetical protein